ncbi:MAG: LysR family transcriptional regulator [Chloroflexi bacterium]|nr:LysR family transcriptional regulator [Chloroflexota bacterium]
MNLRHLKSFYWAAKLGNYSRAAEQLGVTQPAVFRAVQTLEKAYGVRLLCRETGKLALTNAGQMLFSYAEKIDGLEALADQLMGETTPLAFVFGSTPLLTQAICESVIEWKLEHASTCIGFLSSESSDLYAHLLSGELAFAVAPIVRLPPGLVEDGLGYRDEVGFVAKCGHPLSKRRAVSLEELAAEEFVTTFPTTAVHHLLMQISEEAGLRFKIAMVVADAGQALQLVAGGVGVALVSKTRSAEAIKEGRICPISVKGFSRFIPYGTVTREGMALSGDASSLLSHLRASLQEQLRSGKHE